MDKLQEQIKAIDEKIDAILNSDGALTDEQRADLTAHEAERKGIEEKIAMRAEQEKRREEQEKARAEAERQARLKPAASNRKTDTDKPAGVIKIAAEAKDPSIARTWGFDNFGQFAKEVHTATINQRPSQRIMRGWEEASQMAATGMGEAVASDGGFLVPVEYSNKIFERIYSEESLLSKTDIYNVGGNSISFPRNAETSRATGSRWGGVQAYWASEGTAGTNTKPTFARLTLNLHKLIALGSASDELLEDSGVALEQYLFRCFSDEISFTVNDSLINGTGAGMPVGVLNADCTVSVSKETGQSAATLNATNILKMWARMWAGSRSKSVFLINQDVEPQLYSMQIGTGVANQVVYMPPGGLSGAPYATLMGRPVMPVPYCATLGTVGDIILVDLSQWATAVKGGGPKQAVSMHLYFDRDEQAFRVTYRVDSQPWWPAALTPFKGSNTQSCAVTLATRA
jgi:HK97 family phage major capsid protein